MAPALLPGAEFGDDRLLAGERQFIGAIWKASSLCVVFIFSFGLFALSVARFD
jgi:hypothetical protein